MAYNRKKFDVVPWPRPWPRNTLGPGREHRRAILIAFRRAGRRVIGPESADRNPASTSRCGCPRGLSRCSRLVPERRNAWRP